MSKRVEFYFDFGSPASYLAYTQLPALCAQAGAELVWRPMLLGGVFQSTGNQSPMNIPAKGRYVNAELTRYAQGYGVPFRPNPFFPINTLQVMRGAVGLQRQGSADLPAYLDAVFRGIWAEAKNLGDAQVLTGVLQAAGLDASPILALAADPEVKEELKRVTKEAVDRGVFGAPTFFVGEHMAWGQDRLDYLRELLAAA